MKIGSVYQPTDAGKNALIGQPITQLFRDAPVRVRAVGLRKNIEGPHTDVPDIPEPAIQCQFQSGTQLIAQVMVNDEFFVAVVDSTQAAAQELAFQGMAGLTDDDQVFNGTVPAGNLSLVFKFADASQYKGVVWDLEVMS